MFGVHVCVLPLRLSSFFLPHFFSRSPSHSPSFSALVIIFIFVSIIISIFITSLIIIIILHLHFSFPFLRFPLFCRFFTPYRTRFYHLPVSCHLSLQWTRKRSKNLRDLLRNFGRFWPPNSDLRGNPTNVRTGLSTETTTTCTTHHYTPTKHNTSWRFDLVSPWRLDHPSVSRQDTHGRLGPFQRKAVGGSTTSTRTRHR